METICFFVCQRKMATPVSSIDPFKSESLSFIFIVQQLEDSKKENILELFLKGQMNMNFLDVAHNMMLKYQYDHNWKLIFASVEIIFRET